jgi:hypothetical protein
MPKIHSTNARSPKPQKKIDSNYYILTEDGERKYRKHETTCHCGVDYEVHKSCHECTRLLHGEETCDCSSVNKKYFSTICKEITG